jgi:hypothetical protein
VFSYLFLRHRKNEITKKQNMGYFSSTLEAPPGGNKKNSYSGLYIEFRGK